MLLCNGSITNLYFVSKSPFIIALYNKQKLLSWEYSAAIHLKFASQTREHELLFIDCTFKSADCRSTDTLVYILDFKPHSENKGKHIITSLRKT